MKKYFTVFVALIKNNFAQATEFRSSFLVALMVTVLQIFLQLWLVGVFFQYTDRILDWTKEDVFFLVGMFRVVKGFFDLFMRRNLFGFPTLINSGEFDFVLTKPINSLFLMSLRTQIMSEISGPISGAIILTYALNLSHFDISLYSLFLIIFVCILSLICYYSLFAMFSTIAIYVSRLNAINEFQDVVSQTVRFPIDVISQNNQFVEFLVFPLVLPFTYPVKILLQKLPTYHLFIFMILVFLTFGMLVKFWNFSLKKYSSASS